MPDVTLCADSTSLQHPECIGLADERLTAQPWLRAFSDADDVREFVRSRTERQEIWVAGSDQMDAINLAAALKRDAGDCPVCLLAFEGTGSLYSRACSAGIDEVLDRSAFVGRYNERKRLAASARPAGQGVAGDARRENGPADAFRRRKGEPAACCATPDGVSDPFRQKDQRTAVFPPAAAVATKVVHAPATEHAIPTAHGAKGYMLTVVGAGGGVGKSTVAVLCACCAQQMGLRTVLVDADLQFGDIHYLTGCDDAMRFDEALAAPARLASLAPEGRMPALLAAPRRLEQYEAVEGELTRMLDKLRELFDVVVVNTGTSWGDLHIHLLESSSNTLFVLDQRPSSIRSCQHALELCARCGVASQPFLFALNHCARNALFSSIDVSCALQGAHVDELQEGGRDVEELLGSGQPFDLIDSRNALYVSVERFLGRVLPQGSGAQMPQPSERGRRRLHLVPRRKKAACL